MHTPEQAEQLWCPMMRSECMGDKCAMWRWNRFEKRTEQAIVDDPAMGLGGKRLTTVSKLVGVAGYCGVAGRPEAE